MNQPNLWKFFALALLVLLTGLACGLTAGGDRSDERVVTGLNPTITVSAEDFNFGLSATQAQAGQITFVVRNDGHMPHDFALSGSGVEVKTGLLDPGESETLQVSLTPGAYTYLCTVPGHAMLGMQGAFTITP